MSGIVNKIKEVLHKDTDHSSSTTHSSTTGTHSGVGSSTHDTHGVPGKTGTPSGAPYGTPTTGNTHSTHGTGLNTHSNTTAGPHDSNLANKADPRVDSDRDGSTRVGDNTHNTHNTGLTGSNTHNSGLTGTGHNSGHSNLTGSTGHSTVSGVTSGRTDNTHSHSHNTTSGPHSSNLANKADPRVDSDRDGSNLHSGTGHSSTTHGTHGTSGLGSSNTYGSTNAGPHDSNLANRADPRVDSDRDGSNLHGAHGHSSGLAGNPGTHSNTHSSTSGSSVPPHNSNLLNKLDPRVDSNATTTHSSNTHSSGLTGNNTHNSGLTGSNTHNSGLTGSNTYGATHTAGPHQTDTANKLDPRVDSDRSNTGYGQSGTHTGNFSSTTHTGDSHGVSHSTNAGPHDSNLANKADPRVDSDLDGKGNRHGANTTGGVFGASGSHATSGSGTAQNTAGPHNSDLLNKLDPRVDSDRDHSKTVGGDRTHA